MIAPIVSNEKVIGVFDLESDQLNAYTEDDLSVLQLLTSQVAIIIEKVRLHEQLVEQKRLQAQLEIAREVQLELLPEKIPISQASTSADMCFRQKKSPETITIGLRYSKIQIGITVADAVGKGIPAALLMAFLRASIRPVFRRDTHLTSCFRR
jgi:sigma-B regulation protein RsbU (phosphoserine phosphatase)